MSRPEPTSLLADGTYATIRDLILPTPDELRWRAIPWRASLSEAVVEAQAAAKPVLLWAMDGHPLGTTCSNGIAGRLGVWSDATVQRLAERFVPAADDAGALLRRRGPESDLFRVIAEQGHFAGESVPTDTRQGVYVATPDGRLLASISTNDPRKTEHVLAAALARWQALSAEERRGSLPDAVASAATRDRAPADALVLRVYSRDLPRGGGAVRDRTAEPWNQDHAWFSGEEARRFVPPSRAARVVPRALTERIARFHLVDNVRGQSLPFDAAAIETATLRSAVGAAAGAAVTLRLEGEARAAARGAWPVNGSEDLHHPSPQERGYDVKLLGRAVYDRDRERFTELELVAAGVRWGGTQYNCRADDLAPAPFGVVFVLPDDDRYVPPALASPR